MSVDFGSYSDIYQRHRRTQPVVLTELLRFGAVGPDDSVLEIGCGTANYLTAIISETGASGDGVDPSASMMARAAEIPHGTARTLRKGSAEAIPIGDASIDFAYMVDVVHVVSDLQQMASEAFRVLSPGGRFAIATDSEEDIRNRVPLRSHFPETVAVELKRYPPVSALVDQLIAVGFVAITTDPAQWVYQLTDIGMYRERAASSLRLISDEAHARGMARMEADLAKGPIQAISRYTIIEAMKPVVSGKSVSP